MKRMFLLIIVLSLVSGYLVMPSSVLAGEGDDKHPYEFVPEHVTSSYVDSQIEKVRDSLLPSTQDEWREYEEVLQLQNELELQPQYRFAQEQKIALFSIVAPGYQEFEDKMEREVVQLVESGQYTLEQINNMSIEELASVVGVEIPATPQQEVINSQLRNSDILAQVVQPSISIGTARRGDPILVHNGPWWKPAFYGWWTHAIMTLGYNRYIHAVGPGHRNQYTSWSRSIRGRTIGIMGVWSSSKIRDRAASFTEAQTGEWYKILSPKWDTNHWYCSKLPWAGYFYKSWGTIDIDSNKGYWVTPSNIWQSGWTYLRGFSWRAP